MVTITHVRFAAGGSSPEHLVMLRWREAMGDTNVTDMIEWLESGGVAKLATDAGEHELTVVREPGKPPYLAALAQGKLTNTIAELPRF